MESKSSVEKSKSKKEPLHKVIVLGAGATLGASIFESATIKPPVDADFFSVLEKLASKNNKLKTWLKNLREEMGFPLNGVSMESVFTKLETLANFLPKIKSKKGPTVKKHVDLLGKYSSQIAYCFSEIIKKSDSKNKSCSFHNTIVKNITTKDVIISFNYDCIIDAALKTEGNKKWNASTGYGVKIKDNVKEWHEHEGKKGKNANSSIKLLKLHGSLNWKIISGNIELRDYDKCYDASDRSNTEIIPPVWNKNISEREHFNTIWVAARKALQKANSLVVIGYSVPETDLLSQALFQIDTAKEKKIGKLNTLTIVNPDRNARKKIVAILAKSISPTTNILEYETIKDYSATLTSI